MRCPTCGHQNSDLATRCSACGSALATSAEEEATVPNAPLDDPLSPTGTAERPQVVTGSPQPKLERSSGARAMLRRFGSFLNAHQRALGLGLALVVVAVIGAVWFVTGFTDAPAYTQIEGDLAELLPAYEYAGGTYGSDQTIEVTSVSVTKRQRVQPPEGEQASARRNAYAVDAEAIYDNGRMRVVRDVSATYVYASGNWDIVGEITERGLSLTTHIGVDEAKVLANMGAILDAATPMGAEPLSALYDNAFFQVVGNSFDDAPEKDTATNDLVVHCSREAGFYAYAGNVTAHFAFESGTWRLRSAEAEAGTAQRNYGPLVGTWSGTLVAHDAGGGSCYGAQNRPLTVTIASAEDASAGGGQIAGTVSGLVHLHGRLENDASTNAGDRMLEGAEFDGVISPAFDADTGSSLNADCSVAFDSLEEPLDEKSDEQSDRSEDVSSEHISSEHDRGKRSQSAYEEVSEIEIGLQLSFGTDEDPTLVVARVTTTYRYEEMLFLLLPHQTTARFTDTYLLTRVS